MVRKSNALNISGGKASGNRSRPSSRPSSRRSSFEVLDAMDEEGSTGSGGTYGSPSSRPVRFESYTDIQQHTALVRNNRFGSKFLVFWLTYPV